MTRDDSPGIIPTNFFQLTKVIKKFNSYYPHLKNCDSFQLFFNFCNFAEPRKESPGFPAALGMAFIYRCIG